MVIGISPIPYRPSVAVEMRLRAPAGASDAQVASVILLPADFNCRRNPVACFCCQATKHFAEIELLKQFSGQVTP